VLTSNVRGVCGSNGRVAVVESPPITNGPGLGIRLIRIRTHVIFPIDKTYVHCGNSFVVFAACLTHLRFILPFTAKLVNRIRNLSQSQ
jgi:hypothetical protein